MVLGAVGGISDPVERLAVETSHPSWLIERWINSWGIEATTDFARANLEVPPTAFRVVNARANDKRTATVIETLRSAGAMVSPSAITPSAWRVVGATGLLQELAQAGQIYLQDEASKLVAHVIDARPGDR